uniref:Transmembrane protein n=1 Tax=Acrobeloides nanus TaxID=290746 RepID=A0A914C580_9BILA
MKPFYFYSFLTFFLVLIFPTLQQNLACNSNDGNKLVTCYGQFLSSLNLNITNGSNGTITPTFSEYFVAYIEYLTFNRLSGFNQTCEWVSSRASCLGNDGANCLNFDSFQKYLGLGFDDAYEYLGTYATDIWSCNDGFSLFYQNFYCIDSIYAFHGTDIQQCYETFLNSIRGGINCGAFVNLINCYKTTYTKYCGSIGGYIGCNLATVQAQIDTNQCNNQLPKC